MHYKGHLYLIDTTILMKQQCETKNRTMLFMLNMVTTV